MYHITSAVSHIDSLSFSIDTRPREWWLRTNVPSARTCTAHTYYCQAQSEKMPQGLQEKAKGQKTLDLKLSPKCKNSKCCKDLCTMMYAEEACVATGYCVATPTDAPTKSPTKSPTKAPTDSPVEDVTAPPTESTTKVPTTSPTEPLPVDPTPAPVRPPTRAPVRSPTRQPVVRGDDD